MEEQRKVIKVFEDINVDAQVGKMLAMAIGLLMNHAEKTPDQMVEYINRLVEKADSDFKFYEDIHEAKKRIAKVPLSANPEQRQKDLMRELTKFANNKSLETYYANTPDYVLAAVMFNALENYRKAVMARDEFYGISAGIIK